MSLHAWEVAAILSAMFVVLILDRYPSWLVFSGVLTIMGTLGLAPPSALLEGFATSGVMAVAALFPVAAGLYSTGAISILGQKLIGQPHTARAAQMRILPPVTLSSAFLNNTPLVAMMIPITRDVSRATGITGSKLFMNLS